MVRKKDVGVLENIEPARKGTARLLGIHLQTDEKTVNELFDEVLIQIS